MTEDNDTTENTPAEDYPDYNYGDGINRISIEQKGHFLYCGLEISQFIWWHNGFSITWILHQIFNFPDKVKL